MKCYLDKIPLIPYFSMQQDVEKGHLSLIQINVRKNEIDIFSFPLKRQQ